jgi:translation initiation factor 2 subunit 3
MDEIYNLDEVIFNQPTINIGMIGSVSNGKSSITYNLTGTNTLRNSDEKMKGITIKLGYANAKIFKCYTCPAPECYQQYPSNARDVKCKKCEGDMELKRHISIVDAPGHNLLMATMLNGTCVMDNTILVEAANNKNFPAPQTREHLIAADIIGLKNSIVCLNKMDLIKRHDVDDKIETLKSYLENTVASNSPIIPVIANYGINCDILCEYICRKIVEPERDLKANAKMIVIRSFNINRQNVKISDLKGGVVGGTIMRGILNIGDSIEILPGLIERNNNENQTSQWTYEPIISQVETINSEKNNLDFAIPGGLIGVGLTVDPSLTAKDRLVGNILRVVSGEKHKQDNYKIFEVLLVKFELIDRDSDNMDNAKLNKSEIVVVNHNACNIKCKIVKIKKNKAELELIGKPICVELGDYITISKNLDSNVILMGRAEIIDGVESKRKIDIKDDYIS